MWRTKNIYKKNTKEREIKRTMREFFEWRRIIIIVISFMSVNFFKC